MKEKMELIKDCQKNGFHEWQVMSVSGTLPHQELELKCGWCEAEACTDSMMEL